MTTVPFMRPRFTGARFESHTIPLELLGELSVFEEMLVEVAKWAYLRDHPDRKRSPRGFTEGISIRLSSVEDGSAIPVLVLAIASLELFPTDAQEYFEKARDSIVKAVHAASTDGNVTQFLPEKALGFFDRIGRGLRDGEALEFQLPNETVVARLTKETRRKLLFASSDLQELSEEITIRGYISEVDQADMTFEVQLLDGGKRKAPLGSQHLDTILEAFAGYKSGTRIELQGIGRFNRKGKLLGLDSVEHISLLDPLDLSARLEEMSSLKHGWLEGEGLAPSRDGLLWLSRTYESYISDDCPFPYAYPTPEGGVRLEWELGTSEASLEIDLLGHKAEWHSLDHTQGTESSRLINLDAPDDWKWLLARLSELRGGSV